MSKLNSGFTNRKGKKTFLDVFFGSILRAILKNRMYFRAMEKFGFDKLFAYWKYTNHIPIILFICTVFSIILGIKYFRKESTYYFLLVYCILALFVIEVILNFVIYFFTLNKITYTVFVETLNVFFALIEITTFLFFFKRTLNTYLIKQLTNSFWIFFLIICIIFWSNSITHNVTKSQLVRNSYIINYIELFILLIFCLLYFYDLLTNDKWQFIPINKSPSFWITSGLFFYCIVSIPTLLISDKVITSRNLYFIMGSIHYISFSILFLCLAKAFSCKTTITT